MANRLAASTSPYLRQHAENPVYWYPWGPEALARARAEDRPILLSIGYSACHWCHVMAHESFEDAAVAAVMNAHFVSVKVDREERPDVDAVYMEAVQAMTGHGGWPLTVFLTPDGEPFFGGTYFPPEPRGGQPSFRQLLEAVAEAWRARRPEVAASAARLTEALRRAAPAAVGADLSAEVLERAAARIAAAFDPRHGGLGGAPKFPQASNLRFLLGRAARTGGAELREIVVDSLDAMRRGGIYDHLGGGFHRYSVDAAWTVPHFEKMLYDNAQLARLYLEAFLFTGETAFRTVTEETLDYLRREMVGPEGGFYATQDADTPDGEGATFTWTPAQVRAALPAELAAVAVAWFGVTEAGNFEGTNVLARRRDEAGVAEELGASPAELRARLTRARTMLLEARGRRVQPATDTKVLADWNGLAIDAFARAGAALGREDLVRVAEAAARFALTSLRVDGGLAHSWKDGRGAVPAFLEDYAALADGLLSLYEATFDPAWVLEARQLADDMVAQFADPGGGFFRTGPRHEALIVRQKELADASTPSGNALAAGMLLRLAALTGEPDSLRRVEGGLLVARPLMAEAPSAVGAHLTVLDDWLAGGREVALVGPAEAPETASLLGVLRAGFWPGTVVALARTEDDPATAVVRLLADRPMVGGAPTAYVCRHHVCRAPVTDPAALEAALRAGA